MPTRTLLLVTLLLVLWPLAGHALDYDEAILGDLSSEPGAPTAITLDRGSNLVIGNVNGLSDVRDYLTFTLRDGDVLSELRQIEWVDADLPFLPGNRGYHALISGPTSLIPSATNVGDFLGGDHMDQLESGTDLLAILAGAPLAGTGFATPLGAGTYSYHVQQTGPNGNNYILEFVVIPEPSTALLLGGGLIALARRRREAVA